jgi:hypothetical protein
MSSREKFLAIILIVAMVAVAGGFLGYQLVYKPVTASAKDAAKLQDEVDELELKKTALETDQFNYETRTRKKSLPQDVTVAQREYERLIDRMLRQAKFTGPIITPRPPDTKTDVPQLAGKKPAFTKLDFEVQVKGELLSLVDFLYTFYRQPLLQQVRKITINKPTRSRGETSNRELEFTFTIEALVLDRADDRRVLLAPPPGATIGASAAGATAFAVASVESGLGSPFLPTNVLARAPAGATLASAQKEYRRIADKNIFFDPPRPPEPKKVVVEKKEEEPMEVVQKEPDLGPYLHLTRISHADGRSTALIFDRMKKEDYEIETNAKGEAKVTRYYYQRIDEPNGAVGEIRRKFSENPILQFGSEESGNLRQYKVARCLENELVLEPVDPARDRALKGAIPAALGGVAISSVLPKKLYVWRVGQFLVNDDPRRAMRELTYNWEKREYLRRPLALEVEIDSKSRSRN